MTEVQRPVLKSLIPSESRPGIVNGGIPRSVPRKSHVKRSFPDMPTVRGQHRSGSIIIPQDVENNLTNTKPGNQRGGATYVGNVYTTRPKNPYTDERVTSHPLYGNAELALEPKGPSYRPPLPKVSFDVQMNVMKRKDAAVNPYDKVCLFAA